MGRSLLRYLLFLSLTARSCAERRLVLDRTGPKENGNPTNGRSMDQSNPSDEPW